MNKTAIISLGVIVSLALGEIRLPVLLIGVAATASLANRLLSDSARKAIREPTSTLMAAFRKARSVSMIP